MAMVLSMHNFKSSLMSFQNSVKNHINHLLDIFPLVHYNFVAIINIDPPFLDILKTLKTEVY